MNQYILKPITIQLQQPSETSKDKIPNLMLPIRDNTTPLDNLISQLVQMGFPLIPAIISYFSFKRNMFIYCGQAPFANSIHCEISNDEILIKYIQLLSTEQIAVQSAPAIVPKRVKERKISDVLSKVTEWRKYYNGFKSETGEFIQMPLEEAAQIVGISKKTLDDYLSQIRLGQKFGFDFNKNYEKKIGVLRQFVKKCRQNEKDAQKIEKCQEEKKQNAKQIAQNAQYQFLVAPTIEDQYPVLWSNQNDNLFMNEHQNDSIENNNELSLYNFNEGYQNRRQIRSRNYLEEETASQLELSF